MTPLLSLLITLCIFALIAGVLLWAARTLLANAPISPFMKNVVYVLLVLILLLLFLSEIGWLGPEHGWRHWR